MFHTVYFQLSVCLKEALCDFTFNFLTYLLQISIQIFKNNYTKQHYSVDFEHC